MFAIFDSTAAQCSKIVTRQYSTSFSLGIFFLHRSLHEAIYAIYGFVRFADEIVDSFHDFEKRDLLEKFREDTFRAISDGVSLNPVLQSFQKTVNQYGIEDELIETFLHSMEMDLDQSHHDRDSFKDYILGSAEVVGLMCLRVFCEGDEARYQALKASAMKLGSAFQKVNFLRDLHQDYYDLQRTYFPNLSMHEFDEETKSRIESDIREDFRQALEGIKRLPRGARFGVYVAYVYYRALLQKIESTPGEHLLKKRLRLPGLQKFWLLIHTYVRYGFGVL